MTAVTVEGQAAVSEAVRGPRNKRRLTPSRIAIQVFLLITSILWLAPVLYAVYTSLRSYADTAKYGYSSIAHSLTLQNYRDAWTNSGMMKYFINSLIITVPAVLLTLLLSSFLAFAVSRYSWGLNLSLLMLFTAGNLLPPQVIITPLFRIFKWIPLPQFLSASGSLYDSYLGLILIHVAFQTGFCTFVLSNYMKTLPTELTEAALVDGASLWRQYWQIIMPLCRPPLGALATLEFTWIYNDFFWALILIQTGDKKPITSALNNLKGVYFTNNNLIAAGAIMAAIPTLIVFFALQRQFVKGLTLGSAKG